MVGQAHVHGIGVGGECTATVSIPISCAARWMRSAISPRLAISRRLMAILARP
jgi:hypothetical protein